jgi:hypothetical protein
MERNITRVIAALTFFSALSLLPKKSNTVHVKGFANSVDFPNAKETKGAIEYLKRLGPDKIAWDGDAYAKKSFTFVIKQYLEEVNPNADLLLFVPDLAHPQCSASTIGWKEIVDNDRLKIFTTNVEATGPIRDDGYRDFTAENYCVHGLKALKASEAKKVLILGVGPCVASELSSLSSDNTDLEFVIFDVIRNAKSGKESLQTHLDAGKLKKTEQMIVLKAE